MTIDVGRRQLQSIAARHSPRLPLQSPDPDGPLAHYLLKVLSKLTISTSSRYDDLV